MLKQFLLKLLYCLRLTKGLTLVSNKSNCIKNKLYIKKSALKKAKKANKK